MQMVDLKKHFQFCVCVCVFVWVHTCESAGAVETRGGVGSPGAGVIDSMNTSVGAWSRTQAFNHVATFSIVNRIAQGSHACEILEVENLVLESVLL